MAKKKVAGEDGKTYVMKEKKPIYKRVWFWILVVFIVGGIASSLGGDSDSGTAATPKSSESTPESSEVVESSAAAPKEEPKAEPKEEPKKEEPKKQTADEQYQAILDDYTVKLKEAAPRLAEEYNVEAADNQGGLEGLAELSNAKVADLAEISNEGVGKMADVHFKSGSGKYEDYEAWAGKLMDVYMSEANIIMDAYMASAQ